MNTPDKTADDQMTSMKANFNMLWASDLVSFPIHDLALTPWENYLALSEPDRIRLVALAKDLLADKKIFKQIEATGTLPAGVTWEKFKERTAAQRKALFDASLINAKDHLRASKRSFVFGLAATVASGCSFVSFGLAGTQVYGALISIFGLNPTYPSISWFQGFVLYTILFSAHSLQLAAYTKSVMPVPEPTDHPSIEENNAVFRYQLRLHGTLTGSALLMALLCWWVV